jgi:hypothetical protein
LTALLVSLGFFASLLVAIAPAGAAGGRAPEFSVAVSFEQAGSAAAAYDVNTGGNLTIKLAVTNSGNNTDEATVVLGYDDELDGLYEGELKTWSPQTLNNDTPTQLTFTLEPFLVEYLFIFPMYKPTIWVNVSEVNATSFNQSFDVPSKIAMPLVEDVVATSTNANASKVLLGVDKLTMGVTIKAFAVGKDLTGLVEFYLDDTMGDPIATMDISPAMANDTTMDFEVQDFDLSTLATPPSFGTHTIQVVAWDGVLSDENWSAEFLVEEPLANVVVESVAVSAASGLEGTNVTFTAQLNNTGTADAVNQTVEFLDGTTSLGTVTNQSVAVGQAKAVTFVYTLADVTADTTKTITAKVGASSAWVNVTIVAKVARINITAFSVPDGMRIGDLKNLTASVKNDGTGDATGVVVEFYDGTTKVAASEAFNLTVGSSKDISLAVTLAGAADANHTFFVKAAGAEKNTTKLIGHKLAPASVGVTAFTVKPAKKDKQPQDSTQSFTLSISLKNSGEFKSANCTLTIKEGTKALFTESLALDPGQTVTKTYTWKVKGSGAHTATATLSGAEAGTPATMTTKCTLEYTPGFEVLFLVGAILVAALLVRRRKN